MHFMNPVPMMKLVELIRGLATNDETFQTIKALAEKLGKTVAVSEDFPAFIVNRILLPIINEAVYTLYEGVGGVEAIDTAMRLGATHKMGPLEIGRAPWRAREGQYLLILVVAVSFKNKKITRS